MEFVYVVKRYDLFDLSFPHGFAGLGKDPEQGGHSRELATWTGRIREHGFFVERRWAEHDSSLKQIIPYTLMTHGDEILLLKRLEAGGEARLHGKLSIGVGGHINPIDLDDEAGDADTELDILDAGCRRELEEELVIETSYNLRPVGAINDESGDVGSVHFGIVHQARCETPEVTIRETDVLEGHFVTIDALEELAALEADRFETWSALIIPHLRQILA